MKTLAVALAALATSLALIASPADARPYSGDGRIGAHLSDVRMCSGEVTMYVIDLRNDTRRPRWFRAVAVDNGERVSSRRERVARHAHEPLLFFVQAGATRIVTVTHAGEVLAHRTLRGICY